MCTRPVSARLSRVCSVPSHPRRAACRALVASGVKPRPCIRTDGPRASPSHTRGLASVLRGCRLLACLPSLCGIHRPPLTGGQTPGPGLQHRSSARDDSGGRRAGGWVGRGQRGWLPPGPRGAGRSCRLLVRRGEVRHSSREIVGEACQAWQGRVAFFR